MTEAMKFLALLIGTAVCSKLRRWWRGCDMMQWLNDFQTRWVWSLSLSNADFGYIWSYSHFVCAAAHINSLPLSYGPLLTKLFCFDVAGKIDWSTIFCRLSGLPIANVHSFTKKTCSTRGYVSTLHCRGFVNSSSFGCCRFCRITSNLVSIYTKGRAGRSSVEISESFASSTSLERSYALWHEGSCLFLILITPNLHTRVRRRGNVDWNLDISKNMRTHWGTHDYETKNWSFSLSATEPWQLWALGTLRQHSWRSMASWLTWCLTCVVCRIDGLSNDSEP